MTTPEEDIIKQDQIGEEMYFIMKGDCIVNLLDFRGNDHQALRLLVEGEHFGEVSFLFKCPITCTVVSRNYNTMARLTHPRLRNLMADYPIYFNILKKKALKYKDPNLNLMRKIMNNLLIIKRSKKYESSSVSNLTIQQMIYSLKRETYQKGDIILKEG